MCVRVCARWIKWQKGRTIEQANETTTIEKKQEEERTHGTDIHTSEMLFE